VRRGVRLSLICAVSQNGVIGIENRLPWKLPADLRRFKALTMNHPVIMGRKTFESIGRPLPGRTNIVITHQKDYQAPGCLVAHSLEHALQLCRTNPIIIPAEAGIREKTDPEEESFVIGGASIFKQALPYAGKLYLTQIHQDFKGDTHLFEWDRAAWRETSREEFQPDAANPFSYSFLTFEKQDLRSGSRQKQ